MIKSMTGFGKETCEYKSKKISIEIKSLNSKQLDINAKIPNIYREKEYEIRSEISKKLERGKIDFYISLDNNNDSNNFSLNKALAKKYFDEISSFSNEINVSNNTTDILGTVLRMPDVLKTEKEEMDEKEWNIIYQTINTCIEKADNFRIEEGKVLEHDFICRIRKISEFLMEIESFEQQRMQSIRQRIDKDINQFLNSEKIDRNRLEQELFYYIEKIDFSEEKTRLKKHCNYFIETLNEPFSNGKKLGFISQEIGREINTLGAKANDADIQKLIVQMKDELEKIKEQLLNIL